MFHSFNALSRLTLTGCLSGMLLLAACSKKAEEKSCEVKKTEEAAAKTEPAKTTPITVTNALDTYFSSLGTAQKMAIQTQFAAMEPTLNQVRDSLSNSPDDQTRQNIDTLDTFSRNFKSRCGWTTLPESFQENLKTKSAALKTAAAQKPYDAKATTQAFTQYDEAFQALKKATH